MPVVINSNFAATIASNNLNASNAMLQRSLNRLSSGSRIVNPADDAGGLAVSMKLSAAARRQGAVAVNIANAVSYSQTQDGALSVASKVLTRISELKVLYTDPTKNSTDLANYDVEFVELKNQLTALSSETFNGKALFGTNSAASLTVAVTEDGSTSSAVVLEFANLTNTSTGVGVVTAATSLGATSLTLSAISTAIQNVATLRAENGANQSHLGFASELLTVNKANLEAASSRITDVDVATESTELARWNILVQSGTAMLVQANTSAQNALRLLQ